MEKELLKKKYGLPPMPPIAPGGQGKRNMLRKRDYSPLYWDKYFDIKLDVLTDNGNTFRVYERGQEGPVLLLLHGGGFSALSWALLSVSVTSLVKCKCVAVDLRGHGDTLTSDDDNLSAEQMSDDVGSVVSALYKDDSPPIILIGHSMGGAIAVHTAVKHLIPNLIGLAVIDVVEGTAMEALSSMQSFLRGRPKTFDSMDQAIEWAVRSGQIQNLESAKVSMVGQLKRNYYYDILNYSGASYFKSKSFQETVQTLNQFSPLEIMESALMFADPKHTSTDETGPEKLEQLHSSFTDIIQEESAEGEEIPSPSTSVALNLSDNFKVPSQSSMRHKYTWRIDLSKTEKFWQGWFEGLSQKFLSCDVPKILLLAGPDRLDKDLTVGQMQGKFQMNLLPQCGHAVHEDVPDKVADVLANFMLRHKVTVPLSDFERPLPGC